MVINKITDIIGPSTNDLEIKEEEEIYLLPNFKSEEKSTIYYFIKNSETLVSINISNIYIDKITELNTMFFKPIVFLKEKYYDEAKNEEFIEKIKSKDTTLFIDLFRLYIGNSGDFDQYNILDLYNNIFEDSNIVVNNFGDN